MKNNEEIRNLIEKKRLRYFEVAQAAGISAYTISRWMQTELSTERKERLLKAINSIEI